MPQATQIEENKDAFYGLLHSTLAPLGNKRLILTGDFNARLFRKSALDPSGIGRCPFGFDLGYWQVDILNKLTNIEARKDRSKNILH